MCAEPQAETKLNSYRVPTRFLVAIRSEASIIYVPAVWVL